MLWPHGISAHDIYMSNINIWISTNSQIQSSPVLSRIDWNRLEAEKEIEIHILYIFQLLIKWNMLEVCILMPWACL